MFSVRAQVSDGRVILSLSGSVDSSVVAALLDLAIGDQLTCIFVENGLLRKKEADQVMASFSDQAHSNRFRFSLRLVDAADLFMQKLRGIDSPEEKRRIIGRTFIHPPPWSFFETPLKT